MVSSSLTTGRYRKLIDHIPLLAFLDNGLVLSLNQAALRLLGLHKQTAQPLDLQAAGYAILDDAGREYEQRRLPWIRALHSNRMTGGMCQFVMPDGARRWFEVTAMPVPHQAHGTPATALCMLTHITDRKIREKHLTDELQHVKMLATCFSRVLCTADICYDCTVFRSVLRRALIRLGPTGRLHLFENHQDPEKGLCSRSVCRMPADPAQNARGDEQRVAWQDLPAAWNEALRRHRPIVVKAPLPSDAADAFLRRLDLRSVMLIPVFTAHTVRGFIVAGDSHAGRTWTEDNKRLMHTIADVAGMLLEHKDARNRLLHAQKMEMLGALSGGLVHDFNNVLANIRASLQIAIRDHGTDRALVEEAQTINQEIEKAAGLVRQLLMFGSPPRTQSQKIPVNERIRQTFHQFRRVIPGNIAVKMDFAPHEMVVRLIPSHFEQVVMNLVLNARDAMPQGGTLRISTSVVRGGAIVAPPARMRRKASYVCVAIADTGVGIPADAIDRVFEPFFTTKPSERGTGLGLAIVHSVVTRSRGCVIIDSEVSRGTTVRCYFPGRQTARTGRRRDQAGTG